MKFVLIDETSGATTTSGEALTPQLLALAAQVLTVFANGYVAPYWGGSHYVRAGSSPTDVAPNEVPSHTRATIEEAPDAIAYHTVDGVGIPDIEDGLTLSSTLFGPDGWLDAQSHEIAETIVDPATNTMRADGKGKLFAQEACDPVEVQSFPITLLADGSIAPIPNTAPGLAADGSFTAYVSNFVLDGYFTPNHAGPYDAMTALGLQPASAGPAAPFELVPASGGDYQIWEVDPMAEQQVTGLRASGAPAPGSVAELAAAMRFGKASVAGRLTRRVAKKAHPSSRPHRRGIRMSHQPTTTP